MFWKDPRIHFLRSSLPKQTSISFTVATYMHVAVRRTKRTKKFRSVGFTHAAAASAPTFSVTFGPLRGAAATADCRQTAETQRTAVRIIRSSMFNRGDQREQAPGAAGSRSDEVGGEKETNSRRFTAEGLVATRLRHQTTPI